MDITYSKDGSFKIKTKLTSLLIDSSNKISFSDSEKVIAGAGEYEIAGVSVLGFQEKANLAFVLEVDRMRIGYVYDFDGEITTELSNNLGSVDILVTNSVVASNKIEPFFIITKKADNSGEFVKELGYVAEETSKFSIKKDEISDDQNTKIILLEAK